MVEIKRLKECTLDEAVHAWNTGFEGYYFNMTMNTDAFAARLVNEGLSTEHSIVAFMDNVPVGLVLSGMREVNGKKIAWNGGTGVATSFRRHGIGKALIEKSLEIYKEEAVDIATLEAVLENGNAIALYEQYGYRTIDQLEYLELKGSLSTSPIPPSPNVYTLKDPVYLHELDQLSFYKGMNPWQTHWKNLKGSQALIALDEEGKAIGYANFRKAFSSEGAHSHTIVYQCEAAPEQKDAEAIITFMLADIFGDFSEDITRLVPNSPVSADSYAVCKSLGFQATIKQVFMMKDIS
ncbi:GNAT family N-acetyltransferase [Rossellomorea aquimaris]|uniref:GNAT family N-acetyltransferase n=1 Tax=Rossellomorea aquimaris TaxID=189382 RepID=UPI001CD33D82|nr:GNAT family N-acetyltransferase [Rossellomorea aquimaris]MCA1060329.1 GNAT family N-acetyltransferase [Rossellomorea aquimaris]